MNIIPLLSQGTGNLPGLTVDVQDYGSGCLQIIGNLGGGTINFQGSLDGTNFKPVFGVNSAGVAVTSVTAPDLVFLNLGGLLYFQAPLTGAIAPNVTVLLSKFGQSALGPVLPAAAGGGGTTDVTDRVGRVLGHVAVDSGSLTANQGTANATPWNDNLAQVGGAALSEGQKAMAASIPVVVASDQSAVPISGTVTVAALPQGTVELVDALGAPIELAFLTRLLQTSLAEQRILRRAQMVQTGQFVPIPEVLIGG